MEVNPILLHVDTSTDLCSVALSKGVELIGENIDRTGERKHAALLPLMVEETIKQAGIQLIEIGAISCSMGPGSYTGLRVGLSTCKGLCLGLQKPLIGISTLESLTFSLAHDSMPVNSLIVAMLDAGRNEVYHAIYDKDHQIISAPAPLIITSDSFQNLLDQGYVLYLAGDGIKKSREILSHHPGLHYGNDEMLAKYLHIPSLRKFIEGNFENLAYCVPEYIKSPVYKKYI